MHKQINVKNESISFLDDSLSKQCITFNASGLEYARIIQDMNQQYEMPHDKNRPASSKMMSDMDYFEGTERVRVAFRNTSESVRKLKGVMVPYTVKRGSKRYDRYRFMYELMGTFRNHHQDPDVTSNRNK
jgi:hypothetical protein